MPVGPQPPARQPPGDPWAAGMVTGTGLPSAPAMPATAPPRPDDGSRRQRHGLLLFGGLAGGILAAGVVAVLAVTLADGGLWQSRADPPTDVRPRLAQLCPPPTDIPDRPAPSAAVPTPEAGPRTVDEQAGISYAAYGPPWEPWRDLWRAGTLEVPYRTGQHFVTETYSGGTYHASILSAAVPAADNDALTLNLECVGRQVAADVRAEYYPQPNRMELIRDESTTLGGRPAWVTMFRLHFSAAGLRAGDELSAVAIIDVGRPTAAVLYVSIPGTHRQFDWVVQDVLASVRPT